MAQAGLEDPERHDGRAPRSQSSGTPMSHSMSVETRMKSRCMAPRQSCRVWLATRAAVGGCAPAAGTPRREARHRCQRVVGRSRIQNSRNKTVVCGAFVFPIGCKASCNLQGTVKTQRAHQARGYGEKLGVS